MLRGTEPKDYLPFLHGLELAGQRYILEGGQSVNFWASYFQNAGPDAGPLNDYRPFTSVDCDIWVSESTFAKDKWIRRALKDAELELDSLLPIALFVNSELRTIAAFAGTTWGLSSTGG